MNSLTKNSYQKLVQEIGAIYEGARKAAVEAYWKIGQMIVEVEQNGSLRAGYGDGLIKQLSDDLSQRFGQGFSERNLARMRTFYLRFPILPLAAKLTWSQYVEILPLASKTSQQRLIKKVMQDKLDSKMIRRLVRQENLKHEESEASKELSAPSHLPPSKPLKQIRGKLHTHKIAEKGGALYLDFGFKQYLALTSQQSTRFSKVDIVEAGEDGSLRKLSEAKKGDLYTYEVALDRVIDGDTQWYFVFARGSGGARVMTHAKLRLRGIDCPEIATQAGKEAKKLIEGLLKKAVKVTAVTTKPDKYERYLSDIFIETETGEEIFLNNELLAKGYARLYGGPQPEDWGD